MDCSRISRRSLPFSILRGKNFQTLKILFKKDKEFQVIQVQSFYEMFHGMMQRKS